MNIVVFLVDGKLLSIRTKHFNSHPAQNKDSPVQFPNQFKFLGLGHIIRGPNLISSSWASVEAQADCSTHSALGLPVVYSSHKQSSTFFFLSAWLFTPHHTSNLLCTISLESLLTRIERGNTSLKSASSFSHKIPMRILYNKNNHKEVEKNKQFYAQHG